MRRKIQIKGYTRVYKGKTVKVKPYSRMVGTESSSSSQPGDELKSRKEERVEKSEKKTPVYDYNPDAMTPSGLTRKEFEEVALRSRVLSDYKKAPQFRKEKMLADPIQGRILRESLGISKGKVTSRDSNALIRLADRMDKWLSKYKK